MEFFKESLDDFKIFLKYLLIDNTSFSAGLFSED